MYHNALFQFTVALYTTALFFTEVPLQFNTSICEHFHNELSLIQNPANSTEAVLNIPLFHLTSLFHYAT